MQKFYSQTTHGIAIDQIDKDALYVLEKLRAAGHLAYLVGGSVRDLILNQKPKDFDISTSAKPEEVKALFRSCILIGKRFRLAHIRFGKKVLEVSTFRAGDLESDALITEDNIWGTPEQDVLRRDFTINGLFYDSKDQSVIDYVGGYPDIQKKLLRVIGQPYLRFKQDPVRMIRLLKFQARFGFEVDQQTQIALYECREEIIKSSQARILEELLRMLESKAACPFFKLMTDHGILQILLPLLAEFLEKEGGENVYAFLQELDLEIKEPHHPTLDRAVLLSCLVYPILDRRIHILFDERKKTPHLGEIHHIAASLLDQVFQPFFHIPRRLHAKTVTALTSQYRITPLDRKLRRIRVPKSQDFDLAIAFLKLRNRLEPALQEVVQEWESCYQKFGVPPIPHTPRKRRRRR